MHKRNITEYDRMDLELFILTDILKLPSLHYGYWMSDEHVTKDNLIQAQARYRTTLIALVPEDVQSILDVGCGIGDTARALAEKGYQVTAISPDKNHQKFFTNGAGSPRFIRTRFEELNAEETFDLVLMSESQNYFEMEDGFRQARRHLRPGGYLLVSGLFRKEAQDRHYIHAHTEDEFIRHAEQLGFSLVKRIDITDETRPTIEAAQMAMTDYVEPALDMAAYYLRESAPMKTRLLKFFFRKQRREFEAMLDYFRDRTDAQIYNDHVIYTRLLLQA